MILTENNKAAELAHKFEDGYIYIYYGHNDGYRHYIDSSRRYYPTSALAIKLFCPEELLPEMIKYDSQRK